MATQQVDAIKQEGAADPKVADNSKDEWNEAQLEAGMKMLKEMHIQLRHLRSSIPRLVAPLSAQHKTPHSLLTDYQAAIQTVNNEMMDFREAITGDEGKRVLEFAKERREKIDVPIKPWIVTEHPGWSIRDS